MPGPLAGFLLGQPGDQDARGGARFRCVLVAQGLIFPVGIAVGRGEQQGAGQPQGRLGGVDVIVVALLRVVGVAGVHQGIGAAAAVEGAPAPLPVARLVGAAAQRGRRFARGLGVGRGAEQQQGEHGDQAVAVGHGGSFHGLSTVAWFFAVLI